MRLKQCPEGIIGIYIIDTSLWRKHHIAACRVQFMFSGLCELSQNLQARGIPLLIKKVKKTDDIAQELYQCKKNIIIPYFLIGNMKWMKVIRDQAG